MTRTTLFPTNPYRLSMNVYLNDILMLNNTNSSIFVLPIDMIVTEPFENYTRTYDNTTLDQKQAFYLITNSLRTLRTRADEATVFQLET